MAERVLGLDVGTRHVRVVEVVLSSPPTVSRVGEVRLPPGAVRDGEVLDVPAVGAAIAELWRQTGLRSRDVRLGLTGSRVVVRVIELPDMPSDEMAGAVRFSASDHIPIPLEDAVLGQAVLEPASPGDPGSQPLVKVLIAAAHRSTLDSLLAAVAAGGLRATAVDLVPFALVRAVGGPADTHDGGNIPGGYSDPPAPLAEAIVSVGAGLTTVVVHEGGTPRFVRTVAVGGDNLTTAIADELGLSSEAAEAAKRALGTDADDADPAAADLSRRVARIVELKLSSILGEIQSSLAYWMGSSERPLGRVVLTGAGARAGDVAGRLSLLIGAPVEWGVTLPVDAPEAAAGAGDWADHVVAAGLALGGAHFAGWQIDLCPPQRRRLRFDRQLARRLGAAAAIAVVVLGGLSVRSVLSVRDTKHKLAAQQKVNRGLEAQMVPFAPLQKLNTDLTASRKRVESALAGDVSWTRLLSDFVRSMPDTVWLGSLSVQASPPSPTGKASTTPAPGSGSAATAPTGLGSLQVTATGLDFPSVADWLRKVASDPALSDVTVGAVNKGTTGAQSTVSFGSTATITPAARSDRAARLAKAGL